MQKSSFRASEDEISAEVMRRLGENTTESLFMAVGFNKPLIVKRILGHSDEFGYEPPAPTRTSSEGGTSSASFSGPVNPNCRNEAGATPLHIAAIKGYTDIGRMLCISGANPSARFEGNTPLHLAVAEGCSEFASMLLQHGAQVNERDSFGFTPLHLAAVRNNRLVANLLIGAGADPSLVDGDGKTVAERWNFNAVNPACRAFLAPNAGYGHDPSATHRSTAMTSSSSYAPNNNGPRSAMRAGNASLDPEVVDKVLLARFKSFKSFTESKEVVVLPEQIASVKYTRTIATADLKNFFLSLDSMGAPPDLHERQVVDMLKDGLKLRTSKVPLPDRITFDEFCVVWLKAHAKGLIP